MKSSQSNHSVGPHCGSASNLLNSSRKLNALARTHGFLQRIGSKLKLTPRRLVQALVASALSGHHSLRQLAFEVGLLLAPGDTYSKQALWERIDEGSVDFVKAVVAKALEQSIAAIVPLQLSSLPGVLRILVGDSSTFRFHPCLREHFPGASNQHGVKCAQNRFQLCLDLIGGNWLQAQSDPYNRNDRSAAGDIVKTLVQKGDLIIRDLGYAVIPVFAAIKEKGAFFLSRLNTSAALYDQKGERIDLLALARRATPVVGDTLSMRIYLGKQHRLRCRLVLRNEGENVGAKRRRTLNKLSKRQGSKHSEDYLKLQNWTLMVTNLEESAAEVCQVCELYRLRWRIENLFKIAKSQTKLNKLLAHRSNPHHIELLLWGWVLAMVHLGMRGVFAMAEIKPGADGSTEVEVVERSVFRAMERLLQLAVLSIELAATGSLEELLRRYMVQIDYHDRYEKRRKRVSLPQRMSKIFIDDSAAERTLP